MEKLTSEGISPEQIIQIEDVLHPPNNILAIEYLKNIKLIKSNIEPVIISRTKTYHRKLNIEEDKFASATAIRNALYSGKKDIWTILAEAYVTSTSSLLATTDAHMRDTPMRAP